MALFNDEEQTQGNTLQGGTIDLSLGSASALMMDANMAPGDTIGGTVTLQSDGSLRGSLDIAVTYSESDGAGSTDDHRNKSADAVAQQVMVSTLTYDGADLAGQVATNGGSPLTLYDLAANNRESDGTDLSDLSDPGQGTEFTVFLTLAEGISNAFQNDGINATFTFSLNQKERQ